MDTVLPFVWPYFLFFIYQMYGNCLLAVFVHSSKCITHYRRDLLGMSLSLASFQQQKKTLNMIITIVTIIRIRNPYEEKFSTSPEHTKDQKMSKWNNSLLSTQRGRLIAEVSSPRIPFKFRKHRLITFEFLYVPNISSKKKR